MVGFVEGNDCVECFVKNRKYPPSIIFNEWHRQDSIKRFITDEDARALTAMDIDLIEYDFPTGKTVLLHEVAMYVGQTGKQTHVLAELAKHRGITALCTLYTLSKNDNPANPEVPDISCFRVKKVWPDPEKKFRMYTPAGYAKQLNALVKQLKAELCL